MGDRRANPCRVAGKVKLANACTRAGLERHLIRFTEQRGEIQCPECGRWVGINHYQGPQFLQPHNREKRHHG